MSWAERIEGVILSGFGEDILLGMLLEALEDITPQQAYEHIRDNRPLVAVADKEWGRLRRAAKHLDLDKILQPGYILDTLKGNRPDIVSIIINHPHGMAWLEAQVREARAHLQDERWVKAEPAKG